MRTKVTLVLLFLNVALFFFIFKFERVWITEKQSLEARRRVLGPEATDIRTIEVTNPAGVSYSLVRERDQWRLTKPLDWPANNHAASSIVTELSLLEHETSFPTKDLGKNGTLGLADYGLDKPKLTLAFRSSDPSAAPTELKIGDVTNVGKRLYILSPDGERVHVVNRSLVDTLALPLEKLRSDNLITIEVFEARSLFLQTGSGGQAASGATGLRTRIRRDAARWTFETPIIAAASKLAIDTTIKDLGTLRAKTFNPPPPPTLPSAAPSLRITVEGNNRTETLFLGEPVPTATANATAVAPAPGSTRTAPNAPAANAPASTPAAAAADAGVEYYAQLEGRAALFTVLVPNRLIDALRNAQVKLREKRVLDFDPRTVTDVALAAPISNQPPVALRRIDPNAPEAGWQIARRAEGAQAPQTQPADAALVQRLLLQLNALTALNFQSDAPTPAELETWGFNRPEREITLTFAGSGAPGSTTPPLRLILGTDAERRVYARVAGPNDQGTSVFHVDADILRELPNEPVAWRNRRVHELPAAGRIAALKITDLAKQQTTLEATFNAQGQAEPAARDPAALEKLLVQLRQLNARRFVRDGFTERVMLGGEDRAWRYKVDLTVALPGGAGEQTSTLSLFFTERLGGSIQFGGAKEPDAIFELEQALIDALWPLTEGARDPGPPTPEKK